MKHLIPALLVAACFLCAAGCSGIFEDNAFLWGAVIDSESKAPLAGALVSLDERTVSTGDGGRYSFEKLEPGEHRYEASAECYERGSGIVTLRRGRNELAIALVHLSNARIEGTVADRTTRCPISGAHISARGVTLVTDARGCFKFADIEPGTCTVRAENAGYQVWEKQMTIPLASIILPIRLARTGLTGRIAYCTVIAGKRDIMSMNAAGDQTRSITSTGIGNYHPSLSPDGEKIVFARQEEGVRRIWLLAPGSGEYPLTSGPSDDYPVWSPDGSTVAFQSVRNGTTYIVVGAPDGRELSVAGKGRFPTWSPDGRAVACITGGRIQVYPVAGGIAYTVGPDVSAYYPSWSPDGRLIAYSAKEGDQAYGLYVLDLASREVVRLSGGGSQLRASFSPDSSMLAYHTIGSDSPSTQIYVIPATGGVPLWISRSGGENSDPSWRRDTAGESVGQNP